MKGDRSEAKTWQERGSGTAADPYVVTAPEGIVGQLVVVSARAPQAVWLRYADVSSYGVAAAEPRAADWSHDALHGLLRVEYDGTPDGVEVWFECDSTAGGQR